MKRFLLASLLLALVLPAPAAEAREEVPAEDVPVEDTVKGSYIVTFKDSVKEVRKETERLNDAHGGRVTHQYQAALSGFAIEGISEETAALIARDVAVIRIDKNLVYRADAAGQQTPVPSWGLDRIDQRLLLTNDVYNYDHMGTNVNVYVLDTGIRTTHNDFGGRASFGTNCIGAGQGDGHGHGTAMAGIIGGATYGVAKNANLIAVKVLNNSGVGTLAQVLCGVNWVTANAVGPALANMSLSGPASATLDNAVNTSINSGVFYSVSAGNLSGSSCNRSPAGVAAAMTAAASDIDTAAVQDVKAGFSNFGSCVDLFAPGVGITSTWTGSNTATQTLSGTSASAAHVSGVAAAWLENTPGLTPAALTAQILADATAGQIANPMGTANLLLYRKLVASPSITAATASQRVYEFVTVQGSAFSNFVPGSTRLLFRDNGIDIESRAPYVWRGDFIQARVPPGDLVNGLPTPISHSPITIGVQVGAEISNLVPFQLISSVGILTFQELTVINAANMDISTVLGSPNLNFTRTKDAEVGDVDGDGWPDLVDNTSNNIRNGTHAVVRFNNGNKTFMTAELEPTDPNDMGTYLTTVPAVNGTYIQDATTYDSDLVDLNNDGLPELVEALRPNGIATQKVRVLNNNNGGPGLFLEASNAWFGASTFPGYPDDVAHSDADYNGFVDVAIAYRITTANGTSDLFLNQGGTSFSAGIRQTLTPGFPSPSTHDVFFLDANHDGFKDMVLVNENGFSETFIHDTMNPPTFPPGITIPFNSMFNPSGRSLAGIAADFNNDGFDDVVLGYDEVSIFFNDPGSPGNYTAGNKLDMDNPVTTVYDIEAGDVDLDGSIDLIAVSLDGNLSPDITVRVWLNNGFGTVFTDVTAGMTSLLLPGTGQFQRLSADLIDFDLDGDLDLYITGADCQDVLTGFCAFGQPFGRVPNQFYENLLNP